MAGLADEVRHRLPRLVGGRYELIVRLGEGGMGDVHLARLVGQSDFVKLAVVKCLKLSGGDDDHERQQMFLNEARLAARLNHPNIVQTFEAGDEGGLSFLAMEYLDGQALSAIKRRAQRTGGDRPLGFELFVLMEVLMALDYAHELTDYDGSALSIVHRDVSPHNVFVTYQGATKLVDFGIAKAAGVAVETRTGVIKGKVGYMAPEQLRGVRDIDRRADLFSVGIMLWEALAGRRFWSGQSSDFEIFAKLSQPRQFDPPGLFNPAAPAALSEVCMKALAYDRDARYATAAEFWAALDAAAGEAGVRAGPRDVAKFMTTQFAAERDAVRRRIESWGRDGFLGEGVVPTLGATLDGDAGSGRTTARSGRPPDSLAAGGSRELEGSAPSVLSSLNVGASNPSTRGGPATSRRRSAQGLLWAGGTALLVVGATLFGARGPSRLDAPAAAVAGAVPPAAASTPAAASALAAASLLAAASAAASAPAAVASATLEVTIAPRGGQLFWDGELLGHSPFRGSIPRDDAPHVLRAEAPGHRPRTIALVADRDRVLDIVLTPDARPRAPVPVASAAAKRPQGVPEPAQAGPAAPAGGPFQELEPRQREPTRRPQLDTDVLKKQ
ncbi:MAG: serine/threonine protein kinase [Polyangiaceae bacterium]|nr:serine/threonine protein kinase [Polyangiaceae bacterium]